MISNFECKSFYINLPSRHIGYYFLYPRGCKNLDIPSAFFISSHLHQHHKNCNNNKNRLKNKNKTKTLEETGFIYLIVTYISKTHCRSRTFILN